LSVPNLSPIFIPINPVISILLLLTFEARKATILLYAPTLDPHLQKITELADRVFCIYSEPAPAKGRKAEAKTPREQRTLEAYS
jgi:hypothetical protein